MTQVKQKLLFQLGTNNWQVENEPAPGSGILHEAHHNAYNSMSDVKCYSIYPSKFQKNDKNSELVRIYELNGENIPICESVGPISNRRWHSMSEEEVEKYVSNLESMVYNYLLEIEKLNNNEEIFLCIAHHTFFNCVILKNVMEKRIKNNLKAINCAVYVHGTGLKMYQNELNEEERKVDKNKREFPLKFYPMMNKLEIFSNTKIFKCAIAISDKQQKEFCKLYPKYPKDKVILSLNGYNPKIFNFKNLNTLDTLKELKLKHLNYIKDINNNSMEKEVITISDKLKYVILYVGRLADWKRPDVVIHAANIYNKEFNDGEIITLLVGSGSADKFIKFEKINNSLNNKNVYFCGPLMQNILSKLYNIATVGVFPSKNEPFGMVLIECMACGSPVIGANSGGPKDFVTKDVGLLIEEDNNNIKLSKELSKHVIQFIKTNQKEKRKEACLKLAENFSFESQCQKLFNQISKKISNN